MTARRRFEASLPTIMRDLKSVARKMGATSLRLENNLLTDEGEATIVFDRAGRRYVFRCQKYAWYLDNLRAAQLTMDYLWRALEEYGVTRTEQDVDREFARFFLPFEATPDDSVLLLTDGSNADWWAVLGLTGPNASKLEVVNAYKALAKVHHPDAGGDAEMFKRVRRAYEAGVEAVEEVRGG